MSEEKGRPLPKFGDWDVNDPASAEGFTVIFNKARDEKKTGGKPESPTNVDPGFKHANAPVKKPPAQHLKIGSQFGIAALDSLPFLKGVVGMKERLLYYAKKKLRCSTKIHTHDACTYMLYPYRVTCTILQVHIYNHLSHN